ncbi:putative leucine-rich repeat-containing protein DDB_G0290503 [Macrobrachium rosenbergii]|uniref:putative leucine-rich repeat-containing protein DDB_G0290503 n=1 Tax=Macrobrachium rosenbergii TaxID=79674 RepID=UPI0034D4DDC8
MGEINKERFKEQVLNHFHYAQEQSGGKQVILVFEQRMQQMLRQEFTPEYERDALILAKAARIVQNEIFSSSGVNFNGALPSDCQKVVPTQLKSLITMLMQGTDLKDQETIDSQVCLTVSQVEDQQSRAECPNSDSEGYNGSDSEEEDSSDNEEEDSSDSEEEEITHLDISRKVEKATKENENVLRLEKERLQKDQLITELKKKVEGLTEGGMKMEQNINDLERLNQEKERQIYSVSAEMQKLRNEMTEKAKETEVQIKEKEEKDQRLIILENTVVVPQMEKETLHRDLQQTENSRREMQVTINKLNEDLEKLRQEKGRKQNHIESLNRQNENKTLKINDLEDELQVLTTQKQMAHENSEQLDRCKLEIAEKKEELEKLKEQNLQKDREILRLQNECTQKQKEVICLLKESKTVVAEKPKANGKLNEMTRRRVQL